MEKEKFEAAYSAAVKAMEQAKQARPDTDLTRLVFVGVFAFLEALGVVDKGE
jgi:hypothetical protein